MKLARAFALTTLFFAAMTATAWFALGQGGHSVDEAAIRKADVDWSHASETKDVEKCVSFYAEDGSMMPFGAPIATGKDQIRQTWQHLMSVPGVNLTFAPTKIVVAKAGDMAYDLGTFSLKTNDAQGNTTESIGKYVVVWRKQSAGQWKVVADIFNTDK